MERKVIRKYRQIHRRMLRRDMIAMYVAIGELTDSEGLAALFRKYSGRSRTLPRHRMAEWLIREVGFKVLREEYEFKLVRFCTGCGMPMGWGYSVEVGEEYFCCEECLHKHYLPKEVEEMFTEGLLELFPSYWIDFLTEKYHP